VKLDFDESSQGNLERLVLEASLEIMNGSR
jgi:hypothetical protein